MPAAPLVVLSTLSLTMAVFELTRRAFLGLTVFLAAGPFFPDAARLGVGSVQAQYLLGLGMGDITG